MLDTSVLVAALRSGSGASRRLLVAALEKRYDLLISVPLFIEYEAVLTRREHLNASGLKRAEMVEVLDALAGVTKPVVLAFRWRPMLRDSNDDMVFEAAFNGDANLLVTFNMRDFEGIRTGNLRIVSPGEAVRALEESL